MIRRPEGWTYERRPDRVLLTISRPDLIAKVRYFERLSPLERLGDLLQRHLTQQCASTLPTVEPIVTEEGEYGAIVHIDNAQERGACTLAFVFGDDFYSLIEGVSSRAHASHLRSAIRSLALTEELRLGVRQRRYVFKPPPWDGLVIGEAIAHYFHENYPRVDARITVYPAMPLTSDRQPTIDLQRLLGEHILVREPGVPSGFVVEQRETSVPFVTASGLAGTRWRYHGTWVGRASVIRDIILLRDDTYAYAVELSVDPHHTSAVSEQFEQFARTIRPLPRRATRLAVEETFSHWTD